MAITVKGKGRAKEHLERVVEICSYLEDRPVEFLRCVSTTSAVAAEWEKKIREKEA